MDSSGSPVQSLTRAMTLIELLGEHPAGLPIAAIHEATGLHKSTIHRLLNALKSHGYIGQDNKGIYRLTFKFCQLSRKIVCGIGMVNVARRHLKLLAETTRETAHFMIREGGNAVYLHREDCARTMLSAVTTIGQYKPLHITSAGKSLLAAQDDGEVREYWRNADKTKVTPFTIDDFDALLADLAAIRERGYSIDNEENTLGVRCIGIALPAYGTTEAAAISIAGARERMGDARLQELRDALYRTRTDIMANMGF